jgi:hypothetical protein
VTVFEVPVSFWVPGYENCTRHEPGAEVATVSRAS